MNTGLGLSFWRVVNEEGSNGWAQIYARIPFDDKELIDKGALLGVVFDENMENWAERDAEQMAWVEEYFNKLEFLGDLGDFGKRWEEKFPNLNGVWVWVSYPDGKREMRIARWGMVKVVLTRNQQEYDFAERLLPGKVVKGNISSGDKIVVLVGKIKEEIFGKLSVATEEDVRRWNRELIEENVAAAGLVLNFNELLEQEPKNIVIEEYTEKNNKVSEVNDRKLVLDLAEDKLVGPIGWREKLINKWLEFRPVEQKGLVHGGMIPKRKRWSMFLGVLFLLLLVVSLITGSIKMKRTAEQKKWLSFSEPIEKNLLEAKGLVSINSTGAKKLIEDARSAFDKGKNQFVSGKYNKEVSGLERIINDGWMEVSGEKESQIEEILRIDLIRQGFKGNRLGLQDKNQLLILDTAMGIVATAEIKTKDIKVVAGKGEDLGWLDTAVGGNKIVVLNNDGIRNAISGVDLIKFDSAVAKPEVLGSFGGNLYVLDQGNKEIYKYAAVGESFGDRIRWLKQDQTMSSEPVDMAIDSDVWVAYEKGEVEKFRRGLKESFSLSGLPIDIKVQRVAVETDGVKLALLDTGHGWVVMCSKETGICNQVLKSSRLTEATDIEFDGQGNLMVLVGGTVGVMK
ncbi:MAG: hypothetical protein UW41_C0021G0013 [Candidatus Collierbacteria bacterium GW2011_GWC2_44_18]|uniref:Uncharacterized protein n=2 Tax=Microgenomates group TaxID=1794810 RepID=A0A0G1M4X8_9BACT|nr:MAG: hypothetical protein UW16_C0016G0002 [Microgenomates group bacterium GW2011_GWC1_44_10]KKT48687.1 MAG: hypothetical protein UW41_C0021G0013 [Candidatus Collierbacteria bacterium GW2011_GWC2_44_18]KKT66989.1 MAG: hypothetical protein UW60_C0016G0008 [Candidatus Woesebacteria bacterium GW2011_GWA2_44_33]